MSLREPLIPSMRVLSLGRNASIFKNKQNVLEIMTIFIKHANIFQL